MVKEMSDEMALEVDEEDGVAANGPLELDPSL